MFSVDVEFLLVNFDFGSAVLGQDDSVPDRDSDWNVLSSLK
jgi:hypothetical protein